ncbi:helix-turn-helix domain-containing protein [Paenibacillus pinisoli]|uniref:Helix-turn-helix domain-containing protein n=1 Tax=Paenibacillus pinisoli TaxID=1276110 RepID=A0A3A6PNH7_9BACL|nr:helix-turn-helix domain-containing protein [Paenibacillus pinisoli]RJX40938.1 helix-turn-helix domain-containing protein [Paenibacillus pinisoli]
MSNEYSSMQISEQLEIPESTLRRWCKGLEEEGFSFKRTRNRRLYGDRELDVLRELKQRMAIPSAQLETVCKEVMSTIVVIETTAAEPYENEKRERFESLLLALADNLYWSNPQSVVSELTEAYFEMEEGRKRDKPN